METAININRIETAVKDNNLLSFNPAIIGVLELSFTMLDKSIIDANESIRRLAKLFHVDYEELKVNERRKIPALFSTGTESTVTFYKTKRGDRRISIQKINKEASAGNILNLTYAHSKDGTLILVVKVSE
jgi:hypothetical protein|tara:strand:- start:298 stop:687 length:390 start_codon:yes stop_codon:yes gene_type:complete